jgi:hypothetical protein
MITLPTAITFDVDNQDIRIGDMRNCFTCPLAHAFTRALDALLADHVCLTHGSVDVLGGRIVVRIGPAHQAQLWIYTLPTSAEQFIRSFDGGFVVHPETFTVTLMRASRSRMRVE